MLTVSTSKVINLANCNSISRMEWQPILGLFLLFCVGAMVYLTREQRRTDANKSIT